MIDQADGLRQLITSMRQNQSAKIDLKAMKKGGTRVITVTSGKGGVGKTNISVNLAIALGEMGLKVAILDADFGLANIDVMLGVTSKNTLVDVIRDEKSIFEILTEGPSNIKFISGGSGAEELVKLDREQIEKFIENIALLDEVFDVVIVDTGAGLADNVMSFVMAADEVILVTTPEPTSITDAYALIKMVSHRDKEKIIRVIVNRAESISEADNILNKILKVAERFLDIKLYPLGCVLQDSAVTKAVKMQQPFVLSFPKSQAAKHILDISKKVVGCDMKGLNGDDAGFKSFISKFMNLVYRQ